MAEIKPGGMIDKMMTREQRTAAGLDKLSPAEIDYFAQWLRNYRRAAEQKTAEKAVEAAKAGETTATTQQRFLGRDKIVSRVDGTMGPLTGNTVIRLEDGTKWKQANSEDRFRPRVTDAPSVAIFRTAFGYLMRIEGMPDFYVEPVQQ